MNRSDFQELAELHLLHAKALLDGQLYSGAYYICGYTVECALKACIARQTNQFDFPEKKAVDAAWTHELGKLLKVSGLEPDFNAEAEEDDLLYSNWQLVKEWTERTRYERRGQREAEDLMAAVSDPDHGVLACIKRYW